MNDSLYGISKHFLMVYRSISQEFVFNAEFLQGIIKYIKLIPKPEAEYFSHPES